MVSIVSIVDRPRPGLSEHSAAFAFFCSQHGYKAYMLHSCVLGQNDEEPWTFWRTVRLARKSQLALLWSFGGVALTLPLLKLLTPGTRWCVILHEPGGLRAKFSKGDVWYRAIVSALLEYICLIFADWIVVPRSDKLSLVRRVAKVSLPLLYNSSYVAPLRRALGGQAEKIVLYLGRRDLRRKLEMFVSDAFRTRVRQVVPDCQFRFFPEDEGTFGSTEEKLEALSKASVVLNFYTVPYNQSGVTVDVLMNDLPVLVSSLDPNSYLLKQHGLVLDPDVSDESIADAVGRLIMSESREDGVYRVLGDRLGGKFAFDDFWLPWVKLVLGKPG
jgi:hypothetical protein